MVRRLENKQAHVNKLIIFDFQTLENQEHIQEAHDSGLAQLRAGRRALLITLFTTYMEPR